MDDSPENTQHCQHFHGVSDSLELPDSVGSAVGDFDAHTTLPIAVGKIKRV